MEFDVKEYLDYEKENGFDENIEDSDDSETDEEEGLTEQSDENIENNDQDYSYYSDEEYQRNR